MDAAAIGSLKLIIDLYISSPNSFLTVSLALKLEKGGSLS